MRATVVLLNRDAPLVITVLCTKFWYCNQLAGAVPYPCRRTPTGKLGTLLYRQTSTGTYLYRTGTG